MNREDARYMDLHYHMGWGQNWTWSSRFGLPVLNPELGIPHCVVPFDKIRGQVSADSCVVFNLADRRIDRVWLNPDKYLPLLRKCKYVVCPDFSLLLGMDRASILWNVSRSLKLGRYFQDKGLCVFSNAAWAYPDTYDICFEGIPKHSVSFVSTIGTVRKEESKRQFKLGLRAFCERTMPAGLILYGPMPALDFDIPVLRHFDRVSPVQSRGYQPDLF